MKAQATYHSTIIINESKTEGEFDKSFLVRITEMGAFVKVHIANQQLDLTNHPEFLLFKRVAR
jgi:hypothetical protein